MLVLSQLLNSDKLTEGTIHLYFTEARVRSTTLTGFSAVNSAITGADSIISALSKAQGQINYITGISGFVNGGNSFATAGILGTNDNYPLNLMANGTYFLTLDNVTDTVIFRKHITNDFGDNYDIGDSSNKFRNLYLSDHLYTGGLSTNYLLLTNNFTLTVINNYIECNDTGGSFTIDLPDATLYSGLEYEIKKIAGANFVVIDPDGSQTIGGAATYTLSNIGDVIKIKSDGVNWSLTINSTITASNGLTKTANNLTLGGTLTGNTSINGAFRFDMGASTRLDWVEFYASADIWLEYLGGGGEFAQIILDNAGISLSTNQALQYAGKLRTDNLTVQRIYQFPDAAGTIALTSDLSSYVQLLTGSVLFDFPTSSNLTITADNGGFEQGQLTISNNAAQLTFDSSGSTAPRTLSVEALGIRLNTASTHSAILKTDNIATSNKTFQFPNTSGTLALTSDLGSYLPLAGGTMTGPIELSAATPLRNVTDPGQSILIGASGFQISANSTLELFSAQNVEISATQTVASSVVLGDILSTSNVGANGMFGYTEGVSNLCFDTVSGDYTSVVNNATIVNIQSVNFGTLVGKSIFVDQNSIVFLGDSDTEKFIINDDEVYFANIGSTYNSFLNNTLQTANRNFEFPNASGTLALTSDLTSLVDDTAYAGSWNGIVAAAPSKNAVYDKIETLVSKLTGTVLFDFGGSDLLTITNDNGGYAQSIVEIGPSAISISYALGYRLYVDSSRSSLDNAANEESIGVDINGVYLRSDNNNSNTAFLKTTGITSNRTYTLPDASGTLSIYTDVRNKTVNTTDATVTLIDTIATTTDTTIIIECKIIGRRTGGAAGTVGDSATYIRTLRVKNIAGTVTIPTTQTDFTSEDQISWDVTFVINTTNIEINVVGATDNNITWVALTKVSQN